MRELLAIACAGALGSVSRYALSSWSYRLLGERFAYGTLGVNVLGCLLMGIVMQVALTSEIIPTTWRAPISIGFFGAFTTFPLLGMRRFATWKMAPGRWQL